MGSYQEFSRAVNANNACICEYAMIYVTTTTFDSMDAGQGWEEYNVIEWIDGHSKCFFSIFHINTGSWMKERG
jgi:hypothetical protein